MDRLQSIEVFLRVTASGSFSKTGRDLGVTPQAVSKRIGDLERWVGTRLLNRTTRRLSLTEDGRAFHDHCTRGVSAIASGVQLLQAASEDISGTLRVMVRSAICKVFVAPLLGKFLDLYPKISIELIVGNQLPNLVEERIDIGIAGGELPESHFTARKIANFRMVACASPEYLGRYGTPRTMEELARHRCISVRNPDSGLVVPWILRRKKEVFHVPVRASLITNDGEAELQAVLAGAGIAQIASYHVTGHLRSGRLNAVLPTLVSKDYEIYVFMPQAAYIPKRSRAFADFMVQEIRKHPDLLPIVSTRA